jgi:phage terminase large subunit-like protein
MARLAKKPPVVASPELVTLGWQVIEWIEAMLVHGPGDVQGEPIVLDDEQAAFLLKAYALDPVTGRRLIRRAVFSRPKGRAKSELAGMIACAEALGPVRFDGWDAAGSPVGRRVKYPEILCVATEETQAGNTYDNCSYMLSEGRVATEYPGIDVGRRAATSTRILLPDGGTIEPSTSGAMSKDGGKSSFIIFDETHLHYKPELLRLNAFLRRNLGKRKAAEPWAFDTTTMYAPGDGSIAEMTHALYREIQEGKRRNHGLLFDHKQAPSVPDLADTDAVLAALVDVYGPAAEWMDLERIVAEIQDPMSDPDDSRRYWFNQPTGRNVSQWIGDDEFAARVAIGRDVPPDVPVVLALDGSFNDDSTAVVGTTCESVPHQWVVGAWEKPMDARPDWKVDIADVEAAIGNAIDQYRVVELTADPFRWERTLQVFEASGVTVSQFPQTAARMTPATNAYRDAVLHAALTHDGDLRLHRHVTGATVKNDHRGTRLAKVHATRKIDLAVAAVMGLDRAVWWQSQAPVEYDLLSSFG